MDPLIGSALIGGGSQLLGGLLGFGGAKQPTKQTQDKRNLIDSFKNVCLQQLISARSKIYAQLD